MEYNKPIYSEVHEQKMHVKKLCRLALFVERHKKSHKKVSNLISRVLKTFH